MVYGATRNAQSASFSANLIEHLFQDPHAEGTRIFLHYGDLRDTSNLVLIIQETEPEEIDNPRGRYLPSHHESGQRQLQGRQRAGHDETAQS